MNYKALIQIALMILALILVFVYIKPTFASISELQSQVDEYKDAVSKATEFNQRLDDLVRTEKSYSDKDRAALEVFLPDQVDTAQVMRDLEALLSDYNIAVNSLKAGAEDGSNNVDVYLENGDGQPADALPYQDFSISITDSYDNVKMFLALIEANAYPLEIVNMSFGSASQSEEELISFGVEEFNCDMVLRVHSLLPTKTVTSSEE